MDVRRARIRHTHHVTPTSHLPIPPEQSKEEAREWWETIATGLEYVAATGDVGVGSANLLRWLSCVEKGMTLNLPLEDVDWDGEGAPLVPVSATRARLIRTLAALASNQRFSLRFQRRILSALTSLLQRAFDLDYSPVGVVDHLPFLEVVLTLYLSSGGGILLLPSDKHARALRSAIMDMRDTVFSPDAGRDVLARLQPRIQKYDSSAALAALVVASFFISADRAPVDDWLPVFLEADTFISSSLLTEILVSLVADALDAAVDDPPRHARILDMAGPFLERAVQRGIASLALARGSLGGPGSGASRGESAVPGAGSVPPTPQEAGVSRSLARMVARKLVWTPLARALMLGVLNNQESPLTLGLITHLVDVVRTYLHPSNSGPWQDKMAQFLMALAANMTHAVINAHDLMAGPVRSRILDVMEDVMYMALYSKSRSLSRAGEALIEAVMTLEPGRAVERLSEEIVTSLQALGGAHRTQAALSVLSSVLVPWFAGSGWEDLPGIGPRVDPAYRSLDMLFSILDMILPGIDPNDMAKTLATTQAVLSLVTLFPLEAPGGFRASLFTDWMLGFTDRIFACFEQADSKSVLDAIDVDVGEKAYRVRGGSAGGDGGSLVASEGASGGSSMNQMMASYLNGTWALLVNAMDAETYATVIADIDRRLRSRLMMNALFQVRDLVAALVSCPDMESNVKACLSLLAPHALATVREELESARDKTPAGTPRLIWALNILAGLAHSPLLFVVYGDDIRALLPGLFRVEEKAPVLLVSEMIRVGLKYGTTAAFKFGLHWTPPGSDHDDDGKYMCAFPQASQKELDVEWHVPSRDPEVVEAMVSLFQVVWGELEARLQMYAESGPGEEPLTRIQLHSALSVLCGLLKGGSLLLPEPMREVNEWEGSRGVEARDGVWKEEMEKAGVAFPPRLRPHAVFDTLDIPEASRAELEGVRESVASLLHGLVEKVERDAPSDVLGAHILCECIRVHLSLRGPGKQEANVQTRVVKSLFETEVMRASWKRPRVYVAFLAGAMWTLRTRTSGWVAPTENNMVLLEDLYSLAVGPYAAVRAAAQEVLASVLSRFSGMRRELLRRAIETLSHPQDASEDALTGVLFLLTRAPELKFILERGELRADLLGALAKTHQIDKLTILGRASALVAKVSSVSLTPAIRCPGPSVGGDEGPGQRAGRAACAVVEEAEREAHERGIRVLLDELRENRNMHWRHVCFLVLLLTNELRVDDLPSVELVHMFLEKARDELEAVRSGALSGLGAIAAQCIRALDITLPFRAERVDDARGGDGLLGVEVEKWVGKWDSQEAYASSSFVDSVWAGFGGSVEKGLELAVGGRVLHALYAFEDAEEVKGRGEVVAAVIAEAFSDPRVLGTVVELTLQAERGEGTRLYFDAGRAMSLATCLTLVRDASTVRAVVDPIVKRLTGLMGEESGPLSRAAHGIGAEVAFAVGRVAVMAEDVEEHGSLLGVVGDLLEAGWATGKESGGFSEWVTGLSAMLDSNDPRRWGSLLERIASWPGRAGTIAEKVKALRMCLVALAGVGKRGVPWFTQVVSELEGDAGSEFKAIRTSVVSFITSTAMLDDGPGSASRVWIQSMVGALEDPALEGDALSYRIRIAMAIGFLGQYCGSDVDAVTSVSGRVLELTLRGADDPDPSVAAYTGLAVSFAAQFEAEAGVEAAVCEALARAAVDVEGNSYRVRRVALVGIQRYVLMHSTQLAKGGPGPVAVVRAILDALVDENTSEVATVAADAVTGVVVCGSQFVSRSVLVEYLLWAVNGSGSREGLEGVVGPGLLLGEGGDGAVLGGVLGLLGVLASEPYDVKEWMVGLLVMLAKLHGKGVRGVKVAIGRYFGEFWRTHLDGAEAWRGLFGGEEWRVVRGVGGGVNYFA